MTKEPRNRAGQTKRPGRADRDAPPADDTPIIHGAIPPRDVLLRFISEHPEQASKREIAKAFGLDGTVLGSWLHALSYVRNLAAHHQRLWNRAYTIKPIAARH